METELELRIQGIDITAIREKLETLGATFVGDWLQKRYIYDFHPKIENKWIRLRTNGVKNTLTIKHIQDSSVVGTKELEIEVSSFEKTDKILEELGYTKRSIQENKRIRYILNDVEIDIDEWPKIVPHIEFEGNSVEAINEVIKLLDLKIEDATTDDIETLYIKAGYTRSVLDYLTFEEV